MTLLRSILWIFFLLLTGSQLRTWDQEDSFAQIETRLQGCLLRVSQLASRPAPERSLPTSANSHLAHHPSASEQPRPSLNPSHSKSPRPTASRLALPQDPRIFIVEENKDERRWVYRSDHFDFIANAPLRRHVIREFAALFELTHLYCHQLPLNLTRTRTSGSKGGKKLQVHLIEDYAHFIARGGAPGSGGVYLSDVDLVLVPFEGLGLKPSQGGYALDHRRTNQTLIHEATHMLMRGPLLKDGWFVEGAAEYVATIPIGQSTLLLSKHSSSIKNYITSAGYKGRGGHGLGTQITLTPLKDFMEADYPTYQSTPHAYPYALLLFHYFIHSDGNGDGQRLHRYVQALHDGAENSTARKLLLAGRSYRTLEQELVKSCRSLGIDLSFR